MRCKLCDRFYDAMKRELANDPQLGVIYKERLKNDRKRQRACIVRSQGMMYGEIRCLVKTELHAMSSERNSLKCTTHPDALQTTHQLLIRLSTDGPTFYHNYTRADMNPVATFTQEHPIGISRGITRL